MQRRCVAHHEEGEGAMRRLAITASEARAELARRQIAWYVFAAQVRVHPGMLGMYLNGRRPLPPHIAQRIADELAREEREPLAVG
jgi:hypothetical protein